MKKAKGSIRRPMLAALVLTALPLQEAAAASGDLQAAALWVFIASSVLIAGVFLYVARSSREPRDADTGKAYRLRRILFLGAVSAAVIVIAFTLPRSPYAGAEAPPDHLVYATAMRFGFSFSNEPVTSLADLGTVQPINDLSLPVGATVEFRLSSLDVNHSFAVYDARGVLVGQTQAMPGYVNRLRMQFDEPGRYEVLCLEYCGIAHHTMNTAFTVYQP